jgi:hypothetical protein
MTTFLLAALVMATRVLGVWLAVLMFALAGAILIAAVYVFVETSCRWIVRWIRRWRLARDLDREREEHRLRSVALTGTKGLPPGGGPPRVA